MPVGDEGEDRKTTRCKLILDNEHKLRYAQVTEIYFDCSVGVHFGILGTPSHRTAPDQTR